MPNSDICKIEEYSAITVAGRQLLLAALIACFFMFSFSLQSRAEGAETITIYFYSSETNINNFKALKMEFDRYLSEFGTYQFQPFSERETFEQEIKEKQNCVLVLSSWHYTNIYQEYKLTPVLVGSRNGKTSQKNLLVNNGKIDLATINEGRIASASSEHYSKTLLSQMLHDDTLLSQLKILMVPKDIDALMSLGFGMAKAALTTDYSLSTLNMLNPALYKQMKVLAESDEALLLIVAIPEESNEDVHSLVKILQEMPATPNGKKNMRMLGLDDWHPLNSSDITKLEQ
ncbi:hypothetical protein U27_06352 [Candidatus Vecturithrix granuli]|uniref:Uncharacterized protein n=1 Tax=Vecturithrix granuli TaxID=1499967 RepID=A0A081C463_VECG1|nr:hypothetical protein U27_06352 [Candidatus Vecturithrix granuli]